MNNKSIKTVFILGAGASSGAGGPLMHNFIDIAQDLYSLGIAELGDSFDDFKTVFESFNHLQGIYWKSYLNLDNIENLFSLIEFAKRLNKLGTLQPKHIEKLRQATISLIAKTLSRKIYFPLENANEMFTYQPPKQYKMLADNIFNLRKAQLKDQRIDHKFSFLTFNYDLALDYMLNYSNPQIKLYYGLQNEPPTSSIYLLKLHGSMNWFKCNKCDQIKPLPPKYLLDTIQRGQQDVGIIDYSNKRLRSLSGISCSQDGPCKLGSTPFIVPPTWEKSHYYEEIGNVWLRAGIELEGADNIVVIGYSLPDTDQFFKYLYAIGTLSGKRLRKFIVINPDMNALERYHNFLGKSISDRMVTINLKFDGEAIEKLTDCLRIN